MSKGNLIVRGNQQSFQKPTRLVENLAIVKGPAVNRVGGRFATLGCKPLRRIRR